MKDAVWRFQELGDALVGAVARSYWHSPLGRSDEDPKKGSVKVGATIVNYKRHEA